MQTKRSSSSLGYKRKVMFGLQAGIALLFAILVGMRAVDTGSLQQYGLMFLFVIIFGFKIRTFIRTKKVMP